MKPVTAKNVVRRVAAALTLTVSFIAVERANAACTPATSETAPVSNTTVTCSGATVDQNPTTFAGYGTGNETGVTIDVQAGASVTSTSIQPAATGILISNGTVNNLGRGDSCWRQWHRHSWCEWHHRQQFRLCQSTAREFMATGASGRRPATPM